MLGRAVQSIQVMLCHAMLAVNCHKMLCPMCAGSSSARNSAKCGARMAGAPRMDSPYFDSADRDPVGAAATALFAEIGIELGDSGGDS